MLPCLLVCSRLAFFTHLSLLLNIKTIPRRHALWPTWSRWALIKTLFQVLLHCQGDSFQLTSMEWHGGFIVSNVEGHSNWHSKLGSESEPLGQPLHLGTGQWWAVLQCSCTEKVKVHLAIWRWPGGRILLSAAGYSDQRHHSKPTEQITAIIAADFIQSKSPGARRKVRCPMHATSHLYSNQLQS